MAVSSADLVRPPRTVAELDGVAERIGTSRHAVQEAAVLGDLWARGEDARLYEDRRFEQLPSGRWKLAEQRLANDQLYLDLLAGWNGRGVKERLAELDRERGGYHVFDHADARFHEVEGDDRYTLAKLPICLHDEPPAGNVPAAPLLSGRAAAGQLGELEPESPLGWVVLLDPVPDEAFLIQARGRSMEPRVPDGAYVLAQLGPPHAPGLALATHAALRDPDLGPCTIKELVEDRGGRPRLRSTNPAYAERPILPEGVGCEDVSVFARVVRVLEPRDFAELEWPEGAAPAQPARSWTDRDLQHREAALVTRRESLLAPKASEPPGVKADAPDGAEHERLVLALSADGRHLRVIVPALDLPPQVQRVDVGGTVCRAGNLRRPSIVPVRPQHAPYRVSPLDGDRSLGAAASDLGADGLPVARATAFAAPLHGLGRCLGDIELRLDRVYRLLCPPTLVREVEQMAQNPWARLLATIDGWPVLELDLAEGDGPTREMVRALESVGLGLRQSGLWVDLVGVPPTGHRVLPNGSSCEVFDVASPPVIAVASSLPLPSAEAHVLVVDASGSQQLSLSSGEQWRIRVEDPAPGLVVVEARRRNRDSEHDQVAFWLEESPLPARAPPAAMRVAVQGNEVPDGGRRCLDLAAACGAQAALTVEAPPGWPVTLRWGEGPFPSGVVTAPASDDGSVPLANVRTVLATFFEKHRLAWLDVEACELPNRRLLHERPLSLDETTAAIRTLATHPDVEAIAWLPVPERVERWIQPVLARLGYEIEPLLGAAIPCARWRILRRRLAGGAVERSPMGVLGVAAHAPGLDDPLLLELAEDVRVDGLDVAILTDGEQWIVHWPVRPFSRPARIDLRAALDAADDHALAAAICSLVS